MARQQPPQTTQPAQQFSQQPQTAGQAQGGQQAATQGRGMRLSQVESEPQRIALAEIAEAVKVCAWCADQCIQEANPNMVECIRLCQDVTELGATALELVPRQSRQSTTVLRALQQAMQDCAQECSHHEHGHCQECAEVLGRAAQAIQQFEQTAAQ